MVSGSPTPMATVAASTKLDEGDASLWRHSRGISVEALAWIVLIAVAFVTRFWNLEYRTLHHDESIHTFYSWFFATGETPYVHNPLSHGPFLFHANALVYLLFGDSDASSRFMPALAGVMLVGLPWLLRGSRFLGRWGALAAGFMLLISPSFLYYTRYIRHDPYTCVGALVLLIAIFRYIERPQRRWMFVAFLSVAFLLTNHEIVFAILLVFVGVLFVALLWGALRPMVPVVLATGAAGILLLAARRIFEWDPLPQIPWQNPTSTQQSAYYSDLFENPLVIGAILILVGFIVASFVVMRASVRHRVGPDGYLEAIFGHSAPGSLERGVLNALKDVEGLAIGIGIMLFIFFGLFTTLFTNLNGIATSTYATDGTLLYWLGQHDVQRGSQPWFYFITESFQYEWLAIILCTAASIVAVWRLGFAALGMGKHPRLLFGSFLFGWFAFLFAVLSWAGEKMPWLIMHFLLPAILLGALLLDEVITGAIAWYRSPRPLVMGLSSRQFGFGIAAALVVICGAWFLEAARLTYGGYSMATGVAVRYVTDSALDEWWLLALVPLIGFGIIGFSVVMAGARHTAHVVLIAMVIVTSLFQIHAGFRLAFLEGDIAKDTLIYNTTAPDLKQLDDDLTALSWLALGDDSLQIGYNGCVAWPFTWYFRDNPGAYQISQADVDSGTNLPPIMLLNNDAGRAGGCSMPAELEGYTTQGYVLRWHEPEQNVYRNFAIAPEIEPGRSAWGVQSNPHGIGAVIESIWSSVLTQTSPEGNQRLFRLLFFRENTTGLNPYRFTVYIRDDLLPYYNDIRYGG